MAVYLGFRRSGSTLGYGFLPPLRGSPTGIFSQPLTCAARFGAGLGQRQNSVIARFSSAGASICTM